MKVSAQVNPFVSWDLLWFLCPFQGASGPSSWGTRFRLEGHWVPQSGAQPRAVPDQPCVLESRDVHSQWPSGSCGIFVRRECISSHQEHLARSWCFTGKATKMNYTYVFRFSDVAGDRRERQRVGVLLYGWEAVAGRSLVREWVVSYWERTLLGRGSRALCMCSAAWRCLRDHRPPTLTLELDWQLDRHHRLALCSITGQNKWVRILLPALLSSRFVR